MTDAGGFYAGFDLEHLAVSFPTILLRRAVGGRVELHPATDEIARAIVTKLRRARTNAHTIIINAARTGKIREAREHELGGLLSLALLRDGLKITVWDQAAKSSETFVHGAAAERPTREEKP